MISSLIDPLLRHWRVSLAIAFGFGWVLGGPMGGPPIVQMVGDRVPIMTLASMAGALVGLGLSGVLGSLRPAWAQPSARAALGAAALFGALLPHAPSAWWVPLNFLVVLLFSIWVPVVGANLTQRVPAHERGRMVAWGMTGYYVVVQSTIWLGDVLGPAVLMPLLGAGLLISLRLTAPVRPHQTPAPEPPIPGGSSWWRVLLLLLLVSILMGQLRTVGDSPERAFTLVTRHLELLYHAPVALLAGLILDRNKERVRLVGAAVMALGLGYGLWFALPPPAGALAIHAGTRVGFALWDVFFWTTMAILSHRYGPIAIFAGGSLIQMAGLIVGAALSPLIPPAVLGGTAVVTLFVSQSLVRSIPDPAGSVQSPGVGDVNLYALLDTITGGSLTHREREVAHLLLAGRGTSEIAEQLYVSENTVRTHLRNIYRKADCSSRRELMHLLLQQVVDPVTPP